MKISGQRLAIRHAKYILFLSLSIGLMSSFLQTYLDLKDERERQVTEISNLISFHIDAATRAVYHLDEGAAMEVAKSIVADRRFYKACIVDDFDDVLVEAVLNQPEIESWYVRFSYRMLNIPDKFSIALPLKDDGQSSGRIDVWVDVRYIVEGFARRAVTTAFSGLISTLVLSLVLLIVLYRSLSKPISDISRWVETLKSHKHVGTAPYTGNDELGHLVTCLKDAWMERDKAEVQIHKLAYFDPLTQLPNRRSLIETLTQSLDQHINTGRFGVVMYFDVDRFKTINDSLGHAVGDLLLCEIGRRVLDVVPKGATCARFGGDEFVLLLNEIGQSKDSCTLKAEETAKALLERLAEPMNIEGNILHCSVSIGITLFPERNIDCLEVIRRADTALYRAKAAGRNCYQFYDREMHRVAAHKLSIEEGLHIALTNNQLELWFQPQVDTVGQTVGAEALVRWRHPTQGIISPNDFLPVAEESGLICNIDIWVIEEACRLVSIWQEEGLPKSFGRVSVNISPALFMDPRFIPHVLESLEKHHVPGTTIELEITENMLVSSFTCASDKMAILREQGITFAIDDFGTGYSSLKYLSNLPLDVLKIDRSFVNNLQKGSDETSIIEVIVAMAQKLNLRVVAEGVTSVSEKDCLDLLGCHFYQGFLFSRPLRSDLFYSDLKEDRYLDRLDK